MNLKRVNTCLLVAIIVINSYLLAAPFYPKFVYWWQDRTHSKTSTRTLTKTLRTGNDIPQENRLVVPSMHLDDQIFEGKDMRALKNGPWRLPYTSTPDKGSNTVIVGHRYTYTNPRGTFYNLDKIRLGDQVGVFWQGKKYTYTVTNINEVTSNSMGVESSSADARLTLYTCTPLWLPKDRLVIVAKLETNT
ncbi:MAG TPA: class E sortase [Candidatus Saccharimonadales bacterium]|nr:class E sortase [Candidatus Saccharimonadales bacterium]